VTDLVAAGAVTAGDLALDPVLAGALRGALGLLWVAAAGHKLRDPAAFRAALGEHALLPERAVAPVARGLPILELATGVALWMPLPAPAWAAAAGLASAGLLVLYAAAIGANLLRGRRDVSCGCLGASAEQPLSSALVARNAVLAVASCAAALPVTPRALGALDAFTVGAAVATLALLHAAADQLLAASQRLRAAGASR
jgi:hypothetical protein